jgi:hypothetical protein
MSAPSDNVRAVGSFPDAGPVPYLTDDPRVANELLQQPSAEPVRTWWHVTYEHLLPMVAATGLIPSCWHGGDTCAVFGIDSLTAAPSWRSDDWIVEVRSSAPLGPVKAWWVPPGAILGAWQRGRFYQLKRDPGAEPPIVDGCPCPLSEICREQQRRWLATRG